MFRLKSNEENFQVIDGPFAGRQYHRGAAYRSEDIPQNEMFRFEEIPTGGEDA